MNVKKTFFAVFSAFILTSVAFAAEPVKITIADDATNGARSIKLLEAAGFIKVDPKAGFAPELKDVTEYLYDIEILPVQANTLAGTLDDVDACIVGGSYGIPEGLIPSRNGLFVEGADGSLDNPFICVIVARETEKNDPDYAKVVSAYRTPLVAQFMLQEWKEARYPAFPFDRAQFDTAPDFLDRLNNYKSPRDGKRVIRVGVCGAMNNMWNAVQKVLDDRGDRIFIELVEFDAFPIPNEALNNGDIELNAFQHKAYLAKDIRKNGYKIVPVGDTYLGPQGLYSHKYKSLDELKAAAGPAKK